MQYANLQLNGNFRARENALFSAHHSHVQYFLNRRVHHYPAIIIIIIIIIVVILLSSLTFANVFQSLLPKIVQYVC